MCDRVPSLLQLRDMQDMRDAGNQLILAALLARRDLLLEFKGDIAGPPAFGLRVMTDQFPPDMRNIAPDGPGKRRFARTIGPRDLPGRSIRSPMRSVTRSIMIRGSFFRREQGSKGL
jgi:hypothetical protein